MSFRGQVSQKQTLACLSLFSLTVKTSLDSILVCISSTTNKTHCSIHLEGQQPIGYCLKMLLEMLERIQRFLETTTVGSQLGQLDPFLSVGLLSFDSGQPSLKSYNLTFGSRGPEVILRTVKNIGVTRTNHNYDRRNRIPKTGNKCSFQLTSHVLQLKVPSVCPRFLETGVVNPEGSVRLNPLPWSEYPIPTNKSLSRFGSFRNSGLHKHKRIRNRIRL